MAAPMFRNLPEFYHTALVGLGAILATSVTLRVADFLWFYLVRPSSLSRYKKGSSNADVSAQPWALITGSSDGIGRGFAEELCAQGFNIILHGRNADKLAVVRTDLLKRWPNAHVRTVILDAIDWTEEAMDAMIGELKGLNIRILVNNVGGGPPSGGTIRPFHTLQVKDIDGFVSLNARFPTHLTLKLLPQLTANAPTLVLNLGSFAGTHPIAYLSPYAGSKGFNHAWGRSLDYEMCAEGQAVEVLTLMVGEVQNQWDRSAPTFFRPSARQFAKSALHKVGCGRGLIVPYPTHALQAGLLDSLPMIVRKPVVVNMAKQLLQRDTELSEKGK